MEQIDLRYVLKEVQDFQGSKIQKVFQHDDVFVLHLYKTGVGKTFFVIRPPQAVYLGDSKPPVESLSAFGTRIRKWWTGASLDLVEQVSNERIVRLVITKEEEHHVYIELFGKGNVVICDSEEKILLPWKKQHYTDRSLTRGTPYLLPPERDFVIGMSDAKFFDLFTTVNRNVSTTLAKAGLGRKFAAEVCARAKVDPQSETVSRGEMQALYDEAQKLDKHKCEPALVKDDGQIIGCEPYELITVFGEREDKDSFSQAVQESLVWKEKPSEHEKQIKKVENIISKQNETIKEYEVRIAENNRKAELLYENYEGIKEVLEKAPDCHGLGLVKKIDKKKKTVTVTL